MSSFFRLSDTVGRGLAGRRRVAGEVEDQIVADLRQFQRDAASDATRCAGDEGYRIHADRIDFAALEQKIFSDGVGDFTRQDAATWGVAPRTGEAPEHGNGGLFKSFLQTTVFIHIRECAPKFKGVRWNAHSIRRKE